MGVPATPSHAAEPSGSLAPPGASPYDHVAVGLQQHRLTLAFRGRWAQGNLPAMGHCRCRPSTPPPGLVTRLRAPKDPTFALPAVPRRASSQRSRPPAGGVSWRLWPALTASCS